MPPRVTHSAGQDRKSTRLNSSHPSISYAVFCLKKKKKKNTKTYPTKTINNNSQYTAHPLLHPSDFPSPSTSSFFFFNDTATTEIYTLSLHDALPILHVPLEDSAERCLSKYPSR